jgi:hypothetical protein
MKTSSHAPTPPKEVEQTKAQTDIPLKRMSGRVRRCLKVHKEMMCTWRIVPMM